MSAIMFGSISTLADTSELQRRAFNDAFAEHGLDWDWDRDTYRGMLDRNGGADRVASYAAERGEQVDADAVHDAKSRRFRALLAEEGVTARPGVLELAAAAAERGVELAVVTTTSPDNVTAVLDAVGIGRDQLNLVLDRTDVGAPKPDAEVYRTALERLGIDASDGIAIEDNPGGVASARAAGVRAVAFPNENTADLDLSAAAEIVHELDATALLDELAARS